MIKVRVLEKGETTRQSRRACSGCGKNAAVQIVGQTVIRDNPSSESVDLCTDCERTVGDHLIARRRTRRK